MEALLLLLSVEQREAAPRSSEKTEKQATKSQESWAPTPSLGVLFLPLWVSPPLWEASGAVTDSGMSVSERGIPFFPPSELLSGWVACTGVLPSGALRLSSAWAGTCSASLHAFQCETPHLSHVFRNPA